MSDSVRPQWTATRQVPLSMGFSRQEYWSRLPGPPPKDLPDPGTELTSLVPPALASGFLTTVPLGKPMCFNMCFQFFVIYMPRNGITIQ